MSTRQSLSFERLEEIKSLKLAHVLINFVQQRPVANKEYVMNSRIVSRKYFTSTAVVNKRQYWQLAKAWKQLSPTIAYLFYTPFKSSIVL